jgi:hypothetical protein
MSKHTPAPWVLTIKPAEHDADFTVAEIEQPRSVKYRGAVTRMQSAEHIYGIGRDELIANARLIAAAPDMLEALKAISEVGIREIHDWQAIAERMQATALAAIAKAEGV